MGAGPVRDVGLLDSAVARPRLRTFGEDASPTLALKAAALSHSVASSHAWVDGNKRLAWLATAVFLDLNGSRPDVTDDEAFNLVMDVASSDLPLEKIAARLQLRQAGGTEQVSLRCILVRDPADGAGPSRSCRTRSRGSAARSFGRPAASSKAMTSSSEASVTGTSPSSTVRPCSASSS